MSDTALCHISVPLNIRDTLEILKILDFVRFLNWIKKWIFFSRTMLHKLSRDNLRNTAK